MASSQPGPEPELPNILSLDKSTDSLTSQINEACNILGLSPHFTGRSAQICQPARGSYGPREEWTMRWLLKKLEGPGSDSQSACLAPRVWQLIRELLPRLPVANLARLLRNHGFVDIFLKTFKALRDTLPTSINSTQHQSQTSVSGTSRESSAAADSSPVTIDGSVDLPKTGKKRKRDGSPIENYHKITTSELDIESLYESICDVITHIHALSTDDSYGYSVEYLKKSLQAPTEKAAELLGTSLTLTRYVLGKATAIGSLGQEDLFRRYVDPWVKIWTSRSSRATNSSQELAFSTTSFLPTLELLSVLHDLTSPIIIRSGVSVLENLLLQHIIFPSRESFHSSTTPRAAQLEEGPSDSINQLLAPLQESVFRSEDHTHSEKKRIHPAARFYDIVLKHTSLTTSTQRISESAWLELLFDRIAFQEESTATPDTTKIVKDMLGMLAERDVKLQIAILEKVLSQCSRILEGGHARVDWAVVGLCLHTSPDVFVIPTISKDMSGQRDKKPNQYLSALFASIEETSRSSDTTSAASRKDILETVLVPLVRGFAQARDLSSFIEYWRSNLILTLRMRNDIAKPSSSRHDYHESLLASPGGQTIWEDEYLLQEVATQVEQRLIVRQIEAILKNLSAAFSPTSGTEKIELSQSAAADLTILDCILSGCRTEKTIQQLTGLIKDFYKNLQALCEVDTLPQGFSWRAWRCISTIKGKWRTELHPSLDVQEMEARLAGRALESLAHMDLSCSTEDLMQCLNFVLTMVEASVDTAQRRKLARATMQAVLNGLGQSYESFKHQESKSEESNSPLIEGATSELQRSFFEHLFQYSQMDLAAGGLTTSRSISNSAAWQNFLRSKILENNHDLAKNFRAFQVESLLRIKSDEPYKIPDSDRSAYALAFDSIHQALPRAFNRKQRCKIFNRVSESLLPENLLSPQLLRDHLKLLINYLSYPNRSMNIIRDTFGLTKDSQETGIQETGLVQIVNSLSSRVTSPQVNTEAVDLIKRLAWKVLGSQLSNGMDESTVFCLRIYFENLNLTKYVAVDVDIDILNLILIGVSLDFYRARYNEFPEELQRSLKTLPRLFMDFSKVVCRFIDDSCTSTTTTLAGICQAGVAAGSLAPFADILLASSEDASVNASLQLLVTRALGYKYQEHSSADEPAVEKALATVRRTQRLLAPPDVSDLLEICSKDVDVTSFHEQRSSVSQILGSTTNLDFEKRASIITRVLSEAADIALNRNTLLLLQRLIVFPAGTGSYISEDLLTALAGVVNKLCDALLHPQPFQVLILSLQNINIILQKHPRVTTQWHIDQIMAALTTCASRLLSSTSCTPKQNGLLYLALCRLFSTILAFHRKRLGGRYHLILPALQSLLRPLFIPFVPTTVDISNSPHANRSSPYTATHASVYSRLLLQTADPSLSSLTNHHRSSKESLNLTDATKTAKSIAGQYLHYLVMTYCECQLKGRLEKEVREQMKPGLWAALDAIPQEVMRVMNSALGKEGRGVWKAVYSEWRRDRGGKKR
ncbi:MAG: hypothetical protein Q9216_005735 [Gyalolechia sp. 2 TL-2023]